ncbi:unnamed protein product [Blepharisma stoltei]|uniref:Uncharacterized protein n=1 Tax=Blepharisma stoltei TaxID=1481888 RepID=A0AAU9J9F5_9CILI|nr:unnamed protein product [Blepharisma stoltei]
MDIDESYLSGQYLSKDLETDELTIRLKNLSKALAESPQSPTSVNGFKNLANKLIEISEIEYSELQLIIGCCIADILRIVAPSPIYKEKQVKKAFELFERVAKFLKDHNEPTFAQIMHMISVIGETGAMAIAIKSKCIDIAIKLIQSLLENIPKEIGHSEEIAISMIIITTFDEIHDVKENQIYPVISSLADSYSKKPRMKVVKMALQNLPSEIKQAVNDYIYKLFISSKECKTAQMIGSNKFSIAYRLFKINSDFILTLLSSLSELMNDAKIGNKVIELVGKLASAKKSVLPTLHSHLFKEYLKKFDDQTENAREIVINAVPKFVKNNRDKQDLIDLILKCTGDRLRDKSDKVRKLAVKIICECSKYIILPKKVLERICERIKDKKEQIRNLAIKYLANIYYNEAVFHYALSPWKESVYSIIPNHIIKAYKDIGTEEDQVIIVNTIEDIILPLSTLKDNHFLALVGLYKDLSFETRPIFSSIIQSKQFWGNKLAVILHSQNPAEIEELIGIFNGHIKDPLSSTLIKENKIQHSSALSNLLKNEEISDCFKVLCAPADNSTKLNAMVNLKKLAEKQSESIQGLINQLRAKCGDTIICANYVSMLINNDPDNLQLLRNIGQAYADIVIPFIPQILELLDECADKSPLLDLLCSILGNIRLTQKQKSDLQLILRQMCVRGTVEEAKAASKLAATSMPNNFIQVALLDSIVPKLLVTSENPSLLITHLAALREIILNCPDGFSDYSNTALKFTINELLVMHSPSGKDDEIISEIAQAKIEGIRLLVAWAVHGKFDGPGVMNAQDIYKILIKLCFKLEKYIRSFIVNPGEFKLKHLFSKAEEDAYRIQALKGIFSVIRRSENKHFLKAKHLLLISELVFSENPAYRDMLGDIMLKNIYQRSKLLPPLLSVLGILLSDSHKSKIYREALLQVFKGMKAGALQQQDQNRLLMLQPESYTPYFIYVIAQLSLDSKMAFKLIAAYLEALYKSHKDIDTDYLIYLLKQLKKFKLVGTQPKHEIKTDKNSNKIGQELEEICETMMDHLVKNYANGENAENEQRKILIPSTYFVKRTENKARLSSPMEVVRNVEYEATPASLKRKRNNNDASVSKRAPK